MAEYSTDHLGVCPHCSEEDNTAIIQLTRIRIEISKTIATRYFGCNNCGTKFTVKKTIETEINRS